MKKKRKNLTFDYSKLSPNIIDLALEYFETDEFDQIRKKYGKNESFKEILEKETFVINLYTYKQYIKVKEIYLDLYMTSLINSDIKLLINIVDSEYSKLHKNTYIDDFIYSDIDYVTVNVNKQNKSLVAS